MEKISPNEPEVGSINPAYVGSTDSYVYTKGPAPENVIPPDADDSAAKRPPTDVEAGAVPVKSADSKPAGKKKEEVVRPSVGFFEVFRFATSFDVAVMFIGILGATAHGLLQPLTAVIFGGVIDGFADPTQYCSVIDLVKTNSTMKEWYQNTTKLFNMTCTKFVSKNQSQLMDDLWQLQTTNPDELEQLMPFLMWANDTGFLNQTRAMCENMLYSQSTFLSGMLEKIIYFVIIGCASWVAGYIQFSTWGMAAENQVKAIRIAFFRNLIRQDVGWYDQQQSGAVTAKFAEDILLIHKGIGDKCALIFQALGAFITGMVIAFVKGWELALVVLSLSPLLGGAAVLMIRFAYRQAQDETNAYAKAGAIAQEVIASIRTVASFGGQLLEVERYAANLDDARKFGTKKGTLVGIMMGLTFFIIFASYALGFSYGIYLINEARPGYSIGVVTTTFFAVIMGTFALGISVTSVQGFAAARSAAYNVFQVIDRRPPIDAFSKLGKKLGPDEKFVGRIEFKNVSFRYPTRPDVQTLQDVSLTVEPGTTVALVGASGCGKSTIIQLLQRFYDPDGGSVEIDGVDLREFNIFWFRTLIGSVSQEPVLFGTSILENIRYGYPGATREEIEHATRLANAHNFIVKLPKGYDTMVGEQGAQLSGGQKQRIAIARALLRNPQILLLDEATSALDTESEAIVQEALDRARAGRTTIAIAHRLSTIMNSDKIIVIDAGRVCEVGTHSELLAQKGIYAKLVEAQQGRENLDIDLDHDTALERRAALAGRKGTITSDTKSPMKELVPFGDEKETAKIDKTAMTPAERKKMQDALVKQHYSLRRLWSMASSEMPYFLAGTVGSLLCGAVWPAFSVIFSQMMSAFTECDPQVRYEKGLTFSLIFLAIGLTCFIGFTVMMAFFSYAGERLVARIRKMMFHAMLRQDTAWFDDEDNSTGALASRLATQCEQVREATGSQLAQFVQNVASLLAAIIIAFAHEWRITLIMLAFVPLLIFGGLAQGKAAGDTVSQDKFVEQAAKYLVQSTTNIRTVTSLGIYRIFIDLFNEPLINRHQRELIKINIAGICFGSSKAVMLFAYATAFYAGATFIENGDTDFGNMFTALAAIMFSAFSVGQANAMAPDQRKAQLSVAEIFKLFDRKPAIDWENSAANATPAQYAGRAAVESVRFHYPTRPTMPILNGLNLNVEPGQTIALVGSSGCGKSTVVQLLERFYDPADGTVRLDDSPLEGLNLPWARGKMSLVSQEPILFDRTIAENISYGVDGLSGTTRSGTASAQDIEAAARMANIHEFIAGLPDGYNTRVGERGGQLSGGQKQRVAIARALIRQPKLLLLDEATSALDSESEKVVQEALDRARAGRTVLVIAHRLSTIENADAIAVIQGGVVRELGTHDDLLAKRGLYFGLWSAQQLTRQ